MKTKRRVIRLVFITCLIISLVLTGCGMGSTEGSSKNETEVTQITIGMIPQVIEKNVTYVKQDGEWVADGSEITNWSVSEDFVVTDTVWIMKSDDATSLYSNLGDYFKDKAATIYMHIGADLKEAPQTTIGKSEDGTEKMDVKIDISCDIVFECDGEKYYYEDVKILGAESFIDGRVNIDVDLGNNETGIISVPTDVEKGQWKDFYHAMPSEEEAMAAESSTYIKSTLFEDIETFDSSSSNLKDNVWDVKITNTEKGENLSPELTWDAVDGASEYVVIMIDGAWLHMDVFTTKTSLAEGEIERGERGNQYVGPYPSSGTHTYSIFIFALKKEMGKVTLGFDSGGNSIDQIYNGLNVDIDGNSGNVIAYSRLDGNYTREE